ncbi:MAG: hypothetical protein ABI321_24405 [Polyangia bacterium]
MACATVGASEGAAPIEQDALVKIHDNMFPPVDVGSWTCEPKSWNDQHMALLHCKGVEDSEDLAGALVQDPAVVSVEEVIGKRRAVRKRAAQSTTVVTSSSMNLTSDGEHGVARFGYPIVFAGLTAITAATGIGMLVLAHKTDSKTCPAMGMGPADCLTDGAAKARGERKAGAASLGIAGAFLITDTVLWILATRHPAVAHAMKLTHSSMSQGLSIGW